MPVDPAEAHALSLQAQAALFHALAEERRHMAAEASMKAEQRDADVMIRVARAQDAYGDALDAEASALLAAL